MQRRVVKLMKTRDIDIRNRLHYSLNEEFLSDSSTLIIDELGLCQGNARVDIAVVNGLIHGYEIKSESDTLERLPGQISVYNKVLDEITIVTSNKHIESVKKLVPEWWGIEVAIALDNEIELSTLRKAYKNPDIEAYFVVQLLWREEALDILRQFELDRGYVSKSRKKIWEKLVDSFSLSDLQYYVREKLKSRKDWRFG